MIYYILYYILYYIYYKYIYISKLPTTAAAGHRASLSPICLVRSHIRLLARQQRQFI